MNRLLLLHSHMRCDFHADHGWQFDGAGACTSIPQLPAGTAPNQQRSCVSAFPTTEAGAAPPVPATAHDSHQFQRGHSPGQHPEGQLLSESM